MQNIKENKKKRNSPTNLGRNPSYSPLPLSLSPCSAQSTLSPYSFTLSHLRVGPPRQTFLLPGDFARAAGFYGDLAESFPPPARTSGLAHIKPVALQPPSSSSRAPPGWVGDIRRRGLSPAPVIGGRSSGRGCSASCVVRVCAEYRSQDRFGCQQLLVGDWDHRGSAPRRG